ncbi:MAG TPA: SagB/ThcOx family dehydrogenase [Candidatus Cloacimonadota bacterium]|nr:SagB/ThcOx family dehydrogenase [Candidatus Cloacimonadota bacterium]
MDIKTFGYLYYKTRGFSRDDIIKHAEISHEEYTLYEQTLSTVFDQISEDRTQADKIGNDFVRLTRYIYEKQSDQELKIPRPDAIKARSGELVPLPAIGKTPTPSMSLQEAISNRRSLRKYSDTAITQDELSFLLWSCSWARDFKSNDKIEITLRNVPSAGARHPLETYLYIRRVQGLKSGLYYYHPIKHCLVLMDASPEKEAEIFEGCFRQEMAATSAVTFIWSAVPYRTIWRYGQRAYRYLYLDAGHAAQNLHLAAESINGGACMIGAYLDELMNDALGLDGIDEYVIYIATVGKK